MTITSAPRSKSAFGRFVHAKRHHAGLTQRELAARVFVTESAVSKWERGLSYPDISLVIPLAAALGVSECELINASDDHQARVVDRQAQTYRRWRGAVLWATIIGYVVAVVASFVVNVAVHHTLSWFWVVLPAVATAFSLTTLPLLVTRQRGWFVLGAFLLSLFSLFAVVQLLYGGAFVVVTVAAVLFAVVLVFLPFAWRTVTLPEPLRQHRVVLILGVDSLALFALIFIVLAQAGNADAYLPLALPVPAVASAFVWAAVLVARYLPVVALYRAAIITAVAAVFVGVAGPVFDALASRASVDFDRVDFSTWSRPYIEGNVALIVGLACLIASLILCAAAIVQGVKRRDHPLRNVA